jgi:hypothetical protein
MAAGDADGPVSPGINNTAAAASPAASNTAAAIRLAFMDCHRLH